jgi:hypothetical protein
MAQKCQPVVEFSPSEYPREAHMVSNMKRMAWVLVGVVMGAVAATSLHARVQLPQPQSRLVEVGNSTVGGRSAYVIRDAQGAGCWLMISSSDGVALAPAPQSACYQK